MGNKFFGNNELELIKIVQDTNAPQYLVQWAKECIINKYIKLIKTLAIQYAGGNCEVADLMQEGILGLMKAVGKFDIDSGLKLSTFAYYWIRNEIQRNLGKNTWMIQTPYNLKQEAKQLEECRQTFFDKYGYKPSTKELAEFIGWKITKVLKVSQTCQHVSSLDHVIAKSDGKDTTPADYISNNEDTAETKLIKEEQNEELSTSLKRILGPREYEILSMQLGFNRPKMSIGEIAKHFKLSSARIKQILQHAKAVIKNSKDMKLLWDNWKN